ncbi:MAG: WhiB family transcriptional regulator [Acidimicrobiales bacterium]|nr:WhiB family transcriptional regulator [Acidimicrobiales bacterium]
MATAWIDAGRLETEYTDHDTAGLAELAAAVRIPAWQADALCREYPASWWFPARGETGTRAEKVCERCLVRGECAAWAMREQPDAGIWAGMTAAAIRRAEAA